MFRFEDKLQEGVFAVGEGYRGWVTDGQTRLRVIVSRELLRSLSQSDRAEDALGSHSASLLELVSEKWEAGLAEESEGGHYVLIVPKDEERIRAFTP